MPENFETKCCVCIPFPAAITVMLFFTVLSLIGCILNILNTFSFLASGIGGIIMLIIVAIGQIGAAYCYVKYIQVFWPYFQKKEDHNDAERNGLVDAFKYLVYAAVVMYFSNAIAILIYALIWGEGSFGISYGITALIQGLVSILISFIIIAWWRNSFENHAAKNAGSGPVAFNMDAIKGTFSTMKAGAADDANKAKADAAAAKDATAAAATSAAAPAEGA